MLATIDHAAMTEALRALELSPEPAATVVVPPAGASRPLRRVAVLPGAFNPPTRAHLALARAALEHGYDAALFALGTRTIGKSAEAGIDLPARAVLLAGIVAGEERLGLVLQNCGLYAEQAEAIHKAVANLDDLAFVVGMDKLAQIFDPRYYDDLERGLEALFARARLLVAARGTLERSGLEATLERPPASRFAARVLWIELDRRYREVSASAVRERLERGEPVGDLVTPGVEDYLLRSWRTP